MTDYDQRTVQFARFMQARDARTFEVQNADGMFQQWEDIGEIGQEEYLNDAVVYLAAVDILTPKPSTDMTAMSHETTGFCFCGQMHGQVKDWNEYDWAALRTHQPAPHLPTREQIAEAISQAVGGYNQNTRTVQHAADAVLALIQNGADRD